MKERRNWREKPRPPAQLDTRRPQPGKSRHKPPAPRAAIDLELLAAIRAWAGASRGESATDEALSTAERPGRFRLKGALDRFFRHYARLNWMLARAGAPQTSEMLWAASSVVLDGLDPAVVAKAVAVTTSDIRALAGTLGRLRADDLQSPEMPEAVRLECPDDLFAAFEGAFGPRLKQELTALNLTAAPDIRVNTLRTTSEGLQAILGTSDIGVRPVPYSPVGLRARGRPDLAATDAFQSGLFEFRMKDRSWSL